MESDETRNRSRLARIALAVGLGAVAVSALRKGKRLGGALAGVGALALGYATVGSTEPTRRFELDELDVSVSEGPGDEADVDLRCAACGEPIRPGQSRGPNEDDEIVHDACK